MSDSLQRVTRSLLRFGGPGPFVASHREPAVGLGIEVDDLGHLRFPLEPDRVEALIARASPSPFGYRDQTVHDKRVRDSWEIPGSQVHLDADVWRQRMERGLIEIRESLGFPDDATVTPVLDKLVIYPSGGFFAPHRDSQKTEHTAATLVLVLPSAHEGGEVVVSHAGRELTFCAGAAASDNYISFLGFYADCVHESKPVERGYRVVLTYRLEVDAPLPMRSATDEVLDLEQSLAAYFEDDPPWLVYLFEHQYTQLSFGWKYLKSGDRLRADAIRRAAAKLDLGCFLALANVHEVHQLGEEDGEDEDDWIPPPSSERRDEDLPPVDGDPSDRPHLVDERMPRLEEDDDEAGDDLTTTSPSSLELEHLMGPLSHRELTLEEWMDARGELCEGVEEQVDDDCIVTTTHSYERDAYEQSYEPWTWIRSMTGSFHVRQITELPSPPPIYLS